MSGNTRIPAELRYLTRNPREITPPIIRRLKQQPREVLEQLLNSTPHSRTLRAGLRLDIPPPGDLSELLAPSVLPSASNANHELRWLCHGLESSAESISALLKTDQQIERKFMRGEHQAALTQLKEAQNSALCFRFVELEYLLQESIGGLSANRGSLNRDLGLTKGGRHEALQMYILELASQRAEKGLLWSQYVSETQAMPEGRDPHNPVRYWAPFVLAPASTPPPNAIAGVIWLMALMPAFDQYRLVCSLAKTSIRLPHARAGDIQNTLATQPLQKLLTAIAPDVRDHALLQLLDPSQTLTEERMPQQNAETTERYYDGDFARALSLSTSALAEDATALDMYLINIKCAARTGARGTNPFVDRTPAHQLYEALGRLLERRENFEASRDYVGRLALSLAHSPLALGLFALLSHENEFGTAGLNPDAYYTAQQHVSPVMARAYSANARAVFLKQLQARSATLAARMSLQSAADSRMQEPSRSDRDLRHMGRDLEAAEDYRAATVAYETALRARPSRAVYVAAVRGLQRCALSAGALMRSATLIVDHMIADPAVFDMSAAKATRAQIDDPARMFATEPLLWPLLVLASEAESSSPDHIAIHDALDDALATLGLERPSQLLSTSLPRDERFWFLLAHVATQDVLDSSWHYASMTAMEEERISICRAILEHSATPTLRQSAEADLNAIALARFRRRAAQHLRQSRIYVDKPALSRMLRPRLAESYARYLAYSRLDETLRVRLKIEGVELDTTATFIFADASLLLFTSLFQSVRDAYVSSNEHGLDSYLSIRLRHGTLAAEIRSPLEAEHLVTKREGSAKYARNAYFIAGLFGHFPAETISRTDQCLGRFSESIDALIETVRSERVRIRSAANPLGLFDYDFGADEIASAWRTALSLFGNTGATSSSSLTAFIDIIFGVLDSRTRAVLERVRVYFAVTLADEIVACIDRLRADIGTIDPALKTTPVERAAVAARTTMVNRLRTDLAEWFREPLSGSADSFSPSELGGLLEEISKTQFPQLRLQTKVNMEGRRFTGERLAPLVDVFHLLLGNAAKHSRIDPVFAAVGIRVEGGRFHLRVENAISPSTPFPEISTACAAIEHALQAPSAARMIRHEGGSGYAKLKKLLLHDLGCGSDYQIAIQAEPASDGANHTFSVELTFSASVLTVETANEQAER